MRHDVLFRGPRRVDYDARDLRQCYHVCASGMPRTANLGDFGISTTVAFATPCGGYSEKRGRLIETECCVLVMIGIMHKSLTPKHNALHNSVLCMRRKKCELRRRSFEMIFDCIE